MATGKECLNKEETIQIKIVAFILNFLFFYIPVSLYLYFSYDYPFLSWYMLFLSLGIVSFSYYLNVNFYFFTNLIKRSVR